MAVSSSFRAFVLEQLGRALPGVRARSMFGGAAILSGDVCFALLANDTLYFRVGQANLPDFEARGMAPFRPFGAERGSMPYHELPVDLLENPDELRPWVEKALGVARQLKAAKGHGAARKKLVKGRGPARKKKATARKGASKKKATARKGAAKRQPARKTGKRR